MTLQILEPELTQASPARGVRITLKHLGKSYSGRQVLKNIDLDIAPGEFVAIVGRSGCGKSTLLRLVAGLEQANDGSIRFEQDGKDHTPEIRFMFQDSRLLPWKRVLDNVALGLTEGKETASQVLEQVGLKERTKEWPAVLSGGQRQRVALARALVHDPDVLLLDEPLGALDALTRIDMQNLIENLWKQRRFTALLVTHDVQEAIALADRVILIEDGQITLDKRIDLPRPRLRGSARFAELEESVLMRVLQLEDDFFDQPLGDLSFLKTVHQVVWAI